MLWLVGVPSGKLDLLSVKAVSLLASCELCLYSGSLIDERVLRCCRRALVVRSALSDRLEDTLYALLCSNSMTVKLVSGSLFAYSGIRELSFYLKALKLAFSIVPSVGALDVAFAYLGCEFLSP